MRYILLFLVFILISCSIELNPPFILVEKNEDGDPYGTYVWIKDDNGYLFRYADCGISDTISHKYDIGDTIEMKDISDQIKTH